MALKIESDREVVPDRRLNILESFFENPHEFHFKVDIFYNQYSICDLTSPGWSIEYSVESFVESTE